MTEIGVEQVGLAAHRDEVELGGQKAEHKDVGLQEDGVNLAVDLGQDGHGLLVLDSVQGSDKVLHDCSSL